MRHETRIAVGPRVFRIGSDWPAPIAALQSLYADYPDASGAVPHFTVRLEATRFWRRFLRPQVAILGDYTLPDAVPVSLAHGLIAAEMAMNLQMALGERRFLLLHASSVERDGKVLIMTGESGSGKSTLSALLMGQGWRFLGDEFALVDPASGLVHPFPRPASLKNEAVDVVRQALPKARYGPAILSTPKGDIRHLIPDSASLSAMNRPGAPSLILFPCYGASAEVREVAPAECFVRLTQASTNYTALGEAGFSALTRLVRGVPAKAIDYPDTETALKQIKALW